MVEEVEGVEEVEEGGTIKEEVVVTMMMVGMATTMDMATIRVVMTIMAKTMEDTVVSFVPVI